MIDPDPELDRLLSVIDADAPLPPDVAERVRGRVRPVRSRARFVAVAAAVIVAVVALLAAPDRARDGEVATEPDPRVAALASACAEYRNAAAGPADLRAGVRDGTTDVDRLDEAIVALDGLVDPASVLPGGAEDLAALTGAFRQARDALAEGDLDAAHGAFSFAVDRYRRSSLATQGCLG